MADEGRRHSDRQKVYLRLRDEVTDFVVQRVRVLLTSNSIKDSAEMIEEAIYATLGSMIMSRRDTESKTAKIDTRDPRNALAVEKAVSEEVCKIAAARLELRDPGARYTILIVKKDRPLKS